MTKTMLPGWQLDLERGPDWLLIRLQPTVQGPKQEIDLAKSVWQIMEQHLAHRLVLDMSAIPLMRSWLIGQLVHLHQLIAQHDGMLRLCNLSPGNQEAIRICRLQDQLPHYEDCHAAVMGTPKKPR